MGATEFPTLAQPEKWDVSLSMPQKTLKHLFTMVHFAMAQQDIRYYLNGLLFVFEPGFVRAVATDGHRLAHSSTVVEGLEGKPDVIVPRNPVLEMPRLLGDTDEPVIVDVATSPIRIRFRHVDLVYQL